jgi:hypothetical protein
VLMITWSFGGCVDEVKVVQNECLNRSVTSLSYNGLNVRIAKPVRNLFEYLESILATTFFL